MNSGVDGRMPHASLIFICMGLFVSRRGTPHGRTQLHHPAFGWQMWSFRPTTDNCAMTYPTSVLWQLWPSVPIVVRTAYE
jgi:hypothetical protein